MGGQVPKTRSGYHGGLKKQTAVRLRIACLK
jgi:hypothetical protein